MRQPSLHGSALYPSQQLLHHHVPPPNLAALHPQFNGPPRPMTPLRSSMGTDCQPGQQHLRGHLGSFPAHPTHRSTSHPSPSSHSKMVPTPNKRDSLSGMMTVDAPSNIHQPTLPHHRSEPFVPISPSSRRPKTMDSTNEESLNSNIEKRELLQAMEKIDQARGQLDLRIQTLHARQKELMVELASQKNTSSAELVPVQPDNGATDSVVQRIYCENKRKAELAHRIHRQALPLELPLYNQPSDCERYQENIRSHSTFAPRLLKMLSRKRCRNSRINNYLASCYDSAYEQWINKVESQKNSAKRRAKDAKNREFFEKSFPDLKKKREQQDRFSRMGTRGGGRSELEIEEIAKEIQEQEAQDRQMHRLACIPPLLVNTNYQVSPSITYSNNNGAVEDPMALYREHQNTFQWTPQQKHIFKEKFCQYPKNFIAIAQHTGKSVTECIKFYYLTKPTENYKQCARKYAMKKRTGKFRHQRMPTPQLPVSDDSTLVSFTTVPTSSLTTITPITVVASIAAGSPTAPTTTVAAIESETPFPDSETPVPAVIPSSTTESLAEGTLLSKPSSSPSLPLPTSWSNSSTFSSMSTGTPVATTHAFLSPSKEVVVDVSATTMVNSVCTTKLSIGVSSTTSSHSSASTYSGASNRDDSSLSHHGSPCGTCRANLSASVPVDCDACTALKKRKYLTCPVKTCENPQTRKLKMLPPEWHNLPAEEKNLMSQELGLTDNVTKCCATCYNRFVQLLENAEESLDSATQITFTDEDAGSWSIEEETEFKSAMRLHGCNWDKLSVTLKASKSSEQCKKFYLTNRRRLNLDQCVQEWKSNKNNKVGRRQPHEGFVDTRKNSVGKKTCPEDRENGLDFDQSDDTSSANDCNEPISQPPEGSMRSDTRHTNSEQSLQPDEKKRFDSMISAFISNELTRQSDTKATKAYVPSKKFDKEQEINALPQKSCRTKPVGASGLFSTPPTEYPVSIASSVNSHEILSSTTQAAQQRHPGCFQDIITSAIENQSNDENTEKTVQESGIICGNRSQIASSSLPGLPSSQGSIRPQFMRPSPQTTSKPPVPPLSKLHDQQLRLPFHSGSISQGLPVYFPSDNLSKSDDSKVSGLVPGLPAHKQVPGVTGLHSHKQLIPISSSADGSNPSGILPMRYSQHLSRSHGDGSITKGTPYIEPGLLQDSSSSLDGNLSRATLMADYATSQQMHPDHIRSRTPLEAQKPQERPMNMVPSHVDAALSALLINNSFLLDPNCPNPGMLQYLPPPVVTSVPTTQHPYGYFPPLLSNLITTRSNDQSLSPHSSWPVFPGQQLFPRLPGPPGSVIAPPVSASLNNQNPLKEAFDLMKKQIPEHEKILYGMTDTTDKLRHDISKSQYNLETPKMLYPTADYPHHMYRNPHEMSAISPQDHHVFDQIRDYHTPPVPGVPSSRAQPFTIPPELSTFDRSLLRYASEIGVADRQQALLGHEALLREREAVAAAAISRDNELNREFLLKQHYHQSSLPHSNSPNHSTYLRPSHHSKSNHPSSNLPDSSRIGVQQPLSLSSASLSSNKPDIAFRNLEHTTTHGDRKREAPKLQNDEHPPHKNKRRDFKNTSSEISKQPDVKDQRTDPQNLLMASRKKRPQQQISPYQMNGHDLNASYPNFSEMIKSVEGCNETGLHAEDSTKKLMERFAGASPLKTSGDNTLSQDENSQQQKHSPGSNYQFQMHQNQPVKYYRPSPMLNNYKSQKKNTSEAEKNSKISSSYGDQVISNLNLQDLSKNGRINPLELMKAVAPTTVKNIELESNNNAKLQSSTSQVDLLGNRSPAVSSSLQLLDQPPL